MLIKNLLRISLLLIALFFINAPVFAADELNSSEQSFINKMVHKYHFRERYLRHLFAAIKPSTAVIDATAHPYEEKLWYDYREHFLTQERISAGAKYWRRHRVALAVAEKKFGVPAAIIVAIIGVESNYGMANFKYSVFNSLATLSFHYSPRAPFFSNELTNYLLLTRELHLNPLRIKGSYAGAIGLPQFMPSSYRRYAVTFGKHAYSDLFHDTNDVIVSVANYLANEGWHQAEPVIIPARLVGDKYNLTITGKKAPKLSVKQLEDYGVYSTETISATVLASLIVLPESAANDKFSYWLTLPNFYVIMRYNPSPMYAMAVAQLALALKQQISE